MSKVISAEQRARIVLIDNFDSFTYNLVDEMRQLDYALVIYRNNVPAAQIFADMEAYAGPQILCLSPGPGHPRAAGNLTEMIAGARHRYPMLGICLGFQALWEASGGVVARCHETLHGKRSLLQRSDHPIFSNLPEPLAIARYHSLAGFEQPAQVDVLATVGDVPMAAYFNAYQALGLQFHPESILSSHGSQLLSQCVQFLFQLHSKAQLMEYAQRGND